MTGAPTGPGDHRGAASRGALRRWGPYVVLALVVLVALYVGSRPSGNRTIDDRVESVASTLKCPQCGDESMATSNAPTSVAGRKEIRRQLLAGRSPDQIRAWFASNYQAQILLTPPRSGLASLVWVLPVVGFVVAAAALAAAFLRWRRTVPAGVSDVDREAVEEARRAHGDGS